MINYVKGDATQPIGGGPKFILHVVNDLGLWGAGFVMAVSRRWSQPEKAYYSLKPFNEDLLGLSQIVKVEDDLWVINMVGQHGVGRRHDAEPPIRYDAIRRCLEQVAKSAKDPAFKGPYRQCSIHAPCFGSGLAGGDWDVIEEIINETLISNGLPVTVYEFAG